jgi:thymidylate kinase
VIALSGVDGAGKSSQAQALRDALVRLGHEAVVEYTRFEWMTLTDNRLLTAIGGPWKVLARLAGRLTSPRSGRGRPQEPQHADPATRLRERSGAVTQAWVTVVALAHASTLRRATRGHLRAGRVVICDRYDLDLKVALRYRYGEQFGFAFQITLVRLLTRRPLRAYLLDVAPETAYARQPEQFGVAELTRQVHLYRDEHESLGVIRLDGERPREELCAELAGNVSSSLR